MPSRRRAVCLSLFVVALTSSFARGQEPLDALKSKLTTAGPIRDTLRKLISGEDPADPKNKLHVDAINTETEWLVRSFNDPYYRDTPPNPPEKDKNKTLGYLLTRLDLDLRDLTRGKNDVQATSAMYTHYFCLHAKALLLGDPRSPPSPLVALNLTRALDNLGALGQGELAETLVELIETDLKKDALPEAERLKDPAKVPNDGMKYYALRGLQRVMAQTPKPPATAILTPEQEQKVVKVLRQLVLTTTTFKDGTTQQEIDGFRVRRREAIKALAQVHNPGVPDKKDGAALTLLRVVARDKYFTPEPTAEERLEAAVGLARMAFKDDKEFNPDYAVYHIGLFLDEFVSFVNNENKVLERPVRVYAARLHEALDGITEQLNDPRIKRTEVEKNYAAAALAEIKAVLERLERSKDSTVSRDGYRLDAWFAGNKPPNMQLFKNVANTAVPPPDKKKGA